MAEWIGQLMIGWLTWLIGIAVIVIFVVGAIVYFYIDGAMWGSTPGMRRRKHGKK